MGRHLDTGNINFPMKSVAVVVHYLTDLLNKLPYWSHFLAPSESSEKKLYPCPFLSPLARGAELYPFDSEGGAGSVTTTVMAKRTREMDEETEKIDTKTKVVKIT